LQAEIAACHARARTPEETDWARIVEFYGALPGPPSPVIELNRAVAVSMAFGPPQVWSQDALTQEHTLRIILPAERTGHAQEAQLSRRPAPIASAPLPTRNARERDLLW
jgi:predicted RNA polymerase sigma factor